MIHVTIANITPEGLAAYVQKAGLSATIFASYGAGAWGVEPGATAAFAGVTDNGAIERLVLDILAERGEKAALMVELTAEAYLFWHEGARYERIE